jgi:signal transduction histidine kinase
MHGRQAISQRRLLQDWELPVCAHGLEAPAAEIGPVVSRAPGAAQVSSVAKEVVARETDEQRTSRFTASSVLFDRLLHDLKQPLNQIRVVAQDLRIDIRKDRLDVGSLPESMAEIEEAVDELVSRIDRFRSFVRSSAIESEPRRADLAAVCRSAIARIRGISAKIEVLEQLSPGLAFIARDPSTLEQALWELLENARLAAMHPERSHPVVEVSTSRRGLEIVVGVLDNGIGVPQNERARIFEPFFTTRQEAAGLGLPLAAALVKESGGRLVLARSDEGGSLFEILLPDPDDGAGFDGKA